MRNPRFSARASGPSDRALELAVLDASAVVMLLLSVLPMGRQAYTA